MAGFANMQVRNNKCFFLFPIDTSIGGKIKVLVFYGELLKRLHNRDANIQLQRYLFSCSCILLTRSSSFSEDKFSRMLSTLSGKLKGVNRSGNVITIFELCILES